ncbi:sigma-54 interaction domain-containing protein [Reinekea marinisedimentorum]|uniref:Transcriptional regulator with GAF, ATPase, and Fis domain n=1 Tax=Reinekea marinisedimentorum TaxID=230495 RepID=A0A4R3IBQ6_9GAMM|nr:sigma-54 dependent transcriptional regulator [Reinekea marinisedimentorum]TCS42711.1 transcriptional regulator with GAF, ATPase, and Fis domain [Reinekea marinisedimentorum]
MDNNTFYRKAIEALTGSLNIEEGLQNCVAFLGTVIPCDILSVHLWDENLCSLKIHATANSTQGRLCNIIIPVEESQRYIPRWEGDLGVKIVNRCDDDPISAKVQDHLKPIYGDYCYSHMVSRVKIGSERICDIALLAAGENRFTDAHAELFASLDSPFGIAVSNSLKHLEILQMHSKLVDENEKLRDRIQTYTHAQVIGSNSGLKHTMQKVNEVAATDAPVLITGETGAGKDIIANAIWRQSQRKNQPYIRVNCGAIPESLIDSELFGHEKGAFTGARERQAGRFERAHNGTIFLDEIGELSKAAQVRLLRVLQNGELERVGGRETIEVNVRIIAATNRVLEDMVARGEFRSDLYYRLCLFPINVPPLRKRLEDIPLFADYFITQCSKKLHIPTPTVAIGEISKLQKHHWPGNVRELANVIERAVISSQGTPMMFDVQMRNDSGEYTELTANRSASNVPTLDELNRDHIQKVLRLTRGKIQGACGAAELLDINPHTLRSRIKKLGIIIES